MIPSRARCWFLLSLGAFPLLVTGADWPQYRGLNHDGSSSETMRTDWAQVPPRVVWRKTLEPAWSSISVSGGRAFTQVNRRVGGEAREVCIALNAATGAESWSADLDRAAYPDRGTGPTDGPRSTPSVVGDRVYVFTSYLKLYCLRADTGAVVWSRDFVAEFPGTETIDWQNAASPLVVGDLVYVNSNVSGRRLMAVRTSDGTTAWSGQNDAMTHATPALATIGGVPQVVFFTRRGLVGVVPETGVVLWRYEFSPSGTSTAATPVIAGDYVYGSCAYALGAWTARIVRSGATFAVQQTDFKRSSSYQNHWATPVHHDGFLYSVVERSFHSLACFDLEGRTNRWTTTRVGSGNPGYASLIKVGGQLLVLTEPGELVVLRPDPSAPVEVARFQALGGTSWNHPAFSGGRIYARSNIEMVVLDVATAAAPLPEFRLEAEALPDLGRLRLRVWSTTQVPFAATDTARIEVQSSPLPDASGPVWNSLGSVAFVLREGGWLEAEFPSPSASALFRAAERRNP